MLSLKSTLMKMNRLAFLPAAQLLPALVLLCVLTSNCHAQEAAAEDQPEGDAEEMVVETVGVELGEFFIRDVRGSEGIKTRFSFTLYADVNVEEEETMREVRRRYEQRIRDHVIIAVRLCKTSHFQEPTLKHLKRRIVSRLYRMVPGFDVNEIMFRDFTYFTD